VFFAALLCSSLLFMGCALIREPTRTPRTAIEQLLLSHAVTRSMSELSLPLSSGETVMVEVVGFPTDRLALQERFGSNTTLGDNSDLPVVRGPGSDLVVVYGRAEARLGELGFALQPRRKDAPYVVRVTVLALGTDQGQTFFGMPPVQSVLLPFALPELTLFKAQRQKAYMRYTIDIYDSMTGRLVRSTPWYQGSAYYNQYTVLFFLSFHGTDLSQAP
jgi:hypothetical protein